MSQVAVQQVHTSSSGGAKKRKHGAAEGPRQDEAGVASTSKDAEERSAKRSKKDKKAGHLEGVRNPTAPPVIASTATNIMEKKKDKKKKHKALVGAGGSVEGESEFHVVSASVQLSIPPVFSLDLPAGARELLDSMLMRYLPALQGVLLAHDRLRFVDDKARIKDECPFAICRVMFDAVVWRPRVGMRLVGKLSLSSPDHISLLLHRTFNVSIPRHHIPVDEWAFEYGPAENDPEFGVGTTEGVGETGKGEDSSGGGRWVHKVTGVKLGDPSGCLDFTVVGLTIANQMLSLVGSLHSDPFSPAHVPTSNSNPNPSQPHDQPASPPEQEVPGQAEESDEEEDTFGMLGRMGDEAARREAEEKKAQADREAKKPKEKKEKKRRKEGAEAGKEGERKKKKV